ncbi:MAG TPA: AMP-binding protein [Ideonella sp.]|uniref:AMP-binding protein n=1 Tax=Ideonella sp. TaxID=1929293 RepID=UPI002E349025|nr:AMP-binding protein [Ideonella sp.]HEX5684504.1 AMP-binding protein [Ideonella sp.]
MAVATAGQDIGDRTRTEALALELARQFLAEVQAGAAHHRPLTLDSALDEDLGLDSLSRVELAVRIERAFGADLPEQVLASAVTLRDLLVALRSGTKTPATAVPAVPPTPWAEAAPAEPVTAATLVEVLDWHAQAHGARVHIVHLGDNEATPISYQALQQRSGAVAAGLQEQGLEPGQTVAIMLPTSPEYFHTFFGVLRAGGVPVPIYPPARLSQIEEHVRRHAGILANAQASILVTVPEARGVARLLEARVAGLRRVLTLPELSAGAASALPVAVRSEDIAFLQYTSGSTGDPKGVVLTHANVLANIRAEGQAIGIRPDDVFVSWLPLYHDMGLISVWLASLYFAAPLVVMSPLAFLARPERWLRAIQQYRGTISAAPNFAYELCVKRIDEAGSEGLDLRSWRLAANGAEPVLPQTLRRFSERFTRRGFRPEAMTPVYGLAESTVGLLCPPLGRGPRIDRVNRGAFSGAGRAEPAAAADTSALEFVCCGRPLPGHEVRIVDALGREVGERVEGRLEFKGPSATRGYYRNPQQTERLFDGDWLDTGDRAYMADAEVYLTGRVKDIIIRGGRNIYPHEVEDAVGSVPGVRRGCVAVFGSPDAATGTERLVVLAETRETGSPEQDALRARILDVTVKVLGEPPDEIVLAPPYAVLKTSSGKLRRVACRELYEQGRVGAHPHAAWWQVVRLAAGSLAPQLRRLAFAAAQVLYGLYGWLVFALLAPPAWLFTTLAPSPAAAWRVNRLAARTMLRLAGMPLTVSGLENLPHTPCVLVANHASYLDGLALFTALPHHFSLVAKRELLGHALARVYLRGLGVQFVERFEPRESVEAARRLADEVAAGTSLGFFPEGTFRRASGLASFRLGAFAAAVAGRVGVLPVAICGTRAILRDGQWLPRRGAVAVTIGKALFAPAGAADTFAAAAALRDAARAQILAHCGEPDAAEA